MSDGEQPKTKIVLPKVKPPKPTDFRSNLKNSHKQNQYKAPQNSMRRAGPRGG